MSDPASSDAGGDTEIDVQALREELDHIKDAMGIQERYEGASAQWLLFGVLVAVAAALSQYVFMADLPDYWYGVIWIGLLFGGGFAGVWYLFGREGVDEWSTSPGGKPSIFFIFGVCYLAVFPIQVLVQAWMDFPSEDAETLFALSVILVLIGVAYLLVGNALKAYYIRARDRYAFYVGGLLMAGLGTAIPFVDFLQTWAYGTLAVVYLAYALATYAVLSRT